MLPRVTIRYFDGCPNWKVALDRVHDALEQIDAAGAEVALEKVETNEEAERVGFFGSPSILIDGRDPFANPDSRVGCLVGSFVPNQAPMERPRYSSS